MVGKVRVTKAIEMTTIHLFKLNYKKKDFKPSSQVIKFLFSFILDEDSNQKRSNDQTYHPDWVHKKNFKTLEKIQQ